MSALESIGSLIAIFEKYAGEDGDKHTLSKPELKKLIQTELKGLIKTSNPGVVEKIMEDLDHNQDKLVDFQEYMTFMAAITMVCHEFFTKAQ